MTTHLPQAPIRTNFIHAVVPLEHVIPGARFVIDGNSKITVGNGTYAEPKPNAFSLPAASVEEDVATVHGLRGPVGHTRSRSCPGSTAVCRSTCYVKGLAKHAPELYAAYSENARWLARVLPDPGYAFLAARALATWIREHAPAGFRWHVSGDVWGKEHAKWIASVCMLAPDVPFWIYTRTLDVVGLLRAADNLAVNVSADRENYEQAWDCADRYEARLTYLVHADDIDPLPDCKPGVCHCPRCTGVPHDLPPGSVIFPDYALRGRELAEPTPAPWWQSLSHEQRAMVCPTDFFGQSEAHRCGPCAKCL